MNKISLCGNILSALFVIFIGYLTFQYFSKNSIMTEDYQITLAFSASANLAIMVWYSSTKESKEKFIVLIILVILILSGAIGKASIPFRGVSGFTLDDFKYYFSFNENWSFILKFLWHSGLDFIVLLMVWLLKHLPLWYTGTIAILNRKKFKNTQGATDK